MRKEAKLSRIPAEDEVLVGVPMKFLGKPYGVTAPESQFDEMAMLWAGWSMPLSLLNKKSLDYKTVPKFKRGVRNLMSKNKFMLSMSDENWVFNWSLSQQILEINVAAKMSKAKIRRLAAFAFGIMMYDTGLRPKQRNFFARKIKREKPTLTGIQKYLGFLKDGMALGRARAAFAFGFMMHLEQVSAKFYGHPLFAMVGEFFFDTDTFEVEDRANERFEVDEDAPLGYEFDPARFDLFYQGLSPSQISAMQGKTVGGIPFEEVLDGSGIAPFAHAMKVNIARIVNNPNDPNHQKTLNFLGLRSPAQFDETKFAVSVSTSPRVIGFNMSYNGVYIAHGNRSEFSRTKHYNALLKVTNKLQGLGAGMHMSASQIEHALKTGKKKITVTAALEQGYRTWNKFGFESKRPLSYEMNASGRIKSWLIRSTDAKIYEMGYVDRQAVLKDLMLEMARTYSLSPSSATPSPSVPQNPPLPSDPNADILEVLKKVLSSYSSYSSAMQRALSSAGITTTTNKRELEIWFGANTLTKAQQQKVHDYFLSGQSTGFESTFRQMRGYPSRLTTSSQPSPQVASHISNLITGWGWFGGQSFDTDAVIDLVKSPQFDVVMNYKDLPELIAVLRAAGQEERSTVLQNARLTPKTQYMQDCMDIEGFSSWWYNNGTSWSGELDLSNGKYSLAVLAMDHYRKMKVQTKPDTYAQAPGFQRARVASEISSLIDPDILADFANLEEVDSTGGGLNRVDVALMEQATRNARLELKDIKKAGLTRVASRWLSGE